MSDTYVFNTPPTDDEEQNAYNRAADIAHNMTADIPDAVLAADADPIDAAHALWTTYTQILLQCGWTACDLAERAHELQAELPEDEDEEPSGDDPVH
jgi:hypothetical protein